MASWVRSKAGYKLCFQLFCQVWQELLPSISKLAGSPECFQKLMELYEKGAVPPMAQPGPDGPRVLQMGFRDGTSLLMLSQHRIFILTNSLQIPDLC